MSRALIKADTTEDMETIEDEVVEHLVPWIYVDAFKDALLTDMALSADQLAAVDLRWVELQARRAAWQDRVEWQAWLEWDKPFGVFYDDWGDWDKARKKSVNAGLGE